MIHEFTRIFTNALQLQKDYAGAERNLEDRRHALKRRIEDVGTAIDRMVYELYGLAAEEIAIVEATSPKA
ncbi:MAG: hypothetical protein ACRDGG_04125 [Anaerolineae bacterium]